METDSLLPLLQVTALDPNQEMLHISPLTCKNKAQMNDYTITYYSPAQFSPTYVSIPLQFSSTTSKIHTNSMFITTQ